MRAIATTLFMFAIGCTPDVAPGTYYCGPNAACPEGQVCSELDNTCLLAGLAQPFACESELASEPDDSADMAYELTGFDCVSLPLVIDACMPTGDPEDWLKLTAPTGCAQAVGVDARITYPYAFQPLGLEIIALATGEVVATDAACAFQGEGGDDLRCANAVLTPGETYGLRIAPTGEDNCDGDCAFNRYTVRVHVGPPD